MENNVFFVVVVADVQSEKQFLIYSSLLFTGISFHIKVMRYIMYE